MSNAEGFDYPYIYHMTYHSLLSPRICGNYELLFYPLPVESLASLVACVFNSSTSTQI